MQAFNRASNFILNDCSFVNNSGQKEPLGDVLDKLKDEAASGVSFDSVDHIPNPSMKVDGALTGALTSDDGNEGPVFFVHSINPANVRAYGESVAKHCKEERVLLASIFFRRILSVFPAEGKRRLVPTLAYQLVVSPYAPEELKIEILGALYMEPDIPEQNLANQFQKLIIRPLQKVANLLPARCPVVFILDSVHNIDCAVVGDVLREFISVIVSLRQSEVPVNAKAVITGIEYDKVLQPLQTDQASQTTSTYSASVTGSSFLFSRGRATCFPVLNWKYDRPEMFQRAVEMTSVVGAMVGVPALVGLTSLAILPAPLGFLVATFGSLFISIGMTTAVSVGVTIVAYREVVRFVYKRSI